MILQNQYHIWQIKINIYIRRHHGSLSPRCGSDAVGRHDGLRTCWVGNYSARLALKGLLWSVVRSSEPSLWPVGRIGSMSSMQSASASGRRGGSHVLFVAPPGISSFRLPMLMNGLGIKLVLLFLITQLYISQRLPTLSLHLILNSRVTSIKILILFIPLF